MKEIESDTYRSIALTANIGKLPQYSIFWWAKRLKILLEMNKQTQARDVIELILNEIETLNINDITKELKIKNAKKILQMINKMPDFLEREKIYH